MASLSVDTGRLGQQAGALGGQISSLSQARDDLTAGVVTARNNRGSVDDEGLHGALQHLSDAWGYEITAIGSDIGSLSGIMNGLAQAYAQFDSQGASAISSQAVSSASSGGQGQ